MGLCVFFNDVDCLSDGFVVGISHLSLQNFVLESLQQLVQCVQFFLCHRVGGLCGWVDVVFVVGEFTFAFNAVDVVLHVT